MSSARVAQVRAVLVELTENGQKLVHILDVIDASGAEDEAARTGVRNVLKDMQARGELASAGRGIVSFVPGAEFGMRCNTKSYDRMWRIIRTENAGWTAVQVRSLARVPQTTLGDYLRWLVQEGFVAQCGVKDRSRLYRATQKARGQRETPYPPRLIKDKYAQARRAVCRLVRIFMEHEPALQRDKIEAECRTILEGVKNEESI